MGTDPNTLAAPPTAAQTPGGGLPRLAWYWGSVAVWMWVIATMSSDAFSATNTNRFIDPMLRYLFPGISVHEILLAHTVIRKTAHFTEFFVLGLLLFWALRRGRATRWRPQWLVQSLIVAGAYALVDEWHQAFVISRTASLGDSGIDFAGAVVSQIWIYLGRGGRVDAAKYGEDSAS